MELTREAVVFQRLMQPVDAIGDIQRGTLVPLGEEVAHGPIHRSRQSNRAAFVGDQGKRSVDGADRRRIAAEHARARVLQVHVEDAVQVGVEQIDDAADGIQHAAILRRPGLSGYDGAFGSPYLEPGVRQPEPVRTLENPKLDP